MISQRIQDLSKIAQNFEEAKKYIAMEEIPYAPDPSQKPIYRFLGAFEACMDNISINHIPGSQLAGWGSVRFAARPEYLTDTDYEFFRKYPEDKPQMLIDSIDERIFQVWPFCGGHIVINHTRLLKEGFSGMIARLDARLRDAALTEKQRDVLTVAKAEAQAVIRFARRHRDHFLKLAETDPGSREEYLAIADCIGHAPEFGARSFREALQSLWFYYYCAQLDDIENHSLGRLDQYLYPYYKKDIEQGVLTPEEAKDLFFEYWLKYSPSYAASENGISLWTADKDDSGDKSARNGLTWLLTKSIDKKHVDIGQTVDISGTDEYGNDLTNEISYLILEVVGELRTIEPKPVLKYSENIDKKFVEACYALIATGHGYPSIAYDENCKRALRMEPNNRYTEQDLANVCHIGCVELGIPAKSYIDPMNAFLNLPKILLVTMNNGVINGKKIGLSLQPARTFAQFQENYRKQIEHFVDLYIAATNESNPIFNEYYMRPLTSMLMDGCMEKAMLIDDGGTEYWAKSVNSCGLATAANSLVAIEHIVYRDAERTMEAFYQTLENNFEGEEAFRQKLLNKLPKYGNGDVDADAQARFVVESFCNAVNGKKTFNGNIYRAGLYSFYATIRHWGAATPATPDGRRAGEVISLNVAPAHGTVKNGLTATLQSIGAYDHALATNASAIDVHLSANTPYEVIDHVSQYIADNKGLFCQFTVANREDMIKAQQDPDRYRDLIVRVSGFSARFLALEKVTQDEIIMRSYWA